MTAKSINLYKEIFYNLKSLRKELVLAKFQVSNTISPNPFLQEKIKNLQDEIARCEEIFSRSHFVTKTKEYIDDSIRLLNDKYYDLAPWKAIEFLSTENDKLVSRVYLVPRSNKSEDSILLLNNASKNDEYINIAYASIMPLSSAKVIGDCKLTNAEKIYSELENHAWQKVTENLSSGISAKV